MITAKYTRKKYIKYTWWIRKHLSGMSSQEAPDVEYLERCLADIRANLILFEELQDIYRGLCDVLDSYMK